LEEMIETAKPIETPEARLAEFRKLGLPEQLAKGLLLSEDYPLFSLAIEKKTAPVLAATIVGETLPYLRRKGVETDKISDAVFAEMFADIGAGKILRDAVPAAIERLAKGEKIQRTEGVDSKEISAEVERLLEERKEFIERNGERALSGLMGELMAKFRGRVDGAVLRGILAEKMRK
jgi:glutamyl-tRNA(Gln) amidotransferase subunit E